MIKFVMFVVLGVGALYLYNHYTYEQAKVDGKVFADKAQRAYHAGAKEMNR